MLNILRKIIPKAVLGIYHLILAKLAAVVYGNPSADLVVIGVTGTNGKSTTVNMISRILEGTGHKTGFTTTINFKVGEREWLNNTKMTMPGRFYLQKLLREMVDSGCQYAIIETSSQGLIQSRHLGVEYDAAVFTNLAPEHIEAHGGFENYKKAKAILFNHLAIFSNKEINNKKIPKVISVNADDDNNDYYFKFSADKKIKYSIERESDFKAENIEGKDGGSEFWVNGRAFEINLPGRFNVYNALAAISVCAAYGVGADESAKALKDLKSVPGRLEYIDEGQPYKVMIDYAPEPNSLKEVYRLLKNVDKNKLIHVLGSAGGGRDKARRPVLGKMAGETADFVIVTNEDPYDEDPKEIINQVAVGAMAAGKKEGENLFLISDREEAIAKAISLAGEGDFVLITGKGAEQAIVAKGGKKVPWDDRIVAGRKIRERGAK